MDGLRDGSLDGATFMFSVDFDLLFEPEIWINALSQSVTLFCGMGMAITTRFVKNEDTVLNALPWVSQHSISIIAGQLYCLRYCVSSGPLTCSGALLFLLLYEVLLARAAIRAVHYDVDSS